MMNVLVTSRWMMYVTMSVSSISVRLEREVSGVYLQAAHCGGVGGERDSGYDSLRRRMSVLDRLTRTHPVWLLLSVSEEEARCILLKQPPGVRTRTRDNVNPDFPAEYLLTLGSITGLPGQEVRQSAEEGPVCASERGPVRNSHQPLPRTREPVQYVSLYSNSDSSNRFHLLCTV